MKKNCETNKPFPPQVAFLVRVFYHTNRNKTNRGCTYSCVYKSMLIPNTCVHTHTHKHIFTHAYTHTCMHIPNTCVHTHTCIYSLMHVLTHVCIHIHRPVLTCHATSFSFNSLYSPVLISRCWYPSCSVRRINCSSTFCHCTKKKTNPTWKDRRGKNALCLGCHCSPPWLRAAGRLWSPTFNLTVFHGPQAPSPVLILTQAMLRTVLTILRTP